MLLGGRNENETVNNTANYIFIAAVDQKKKKKKMK